MKVNGDLCHDLLVQKTRRKLAYRNDCNYEDWKRSIKEKFIELTGVDKILESAKDCPLNIDIERKEEKNGYMQIRFTFESEPGATVPCYLLIPNTGKKKYPVAITLQGHYLGGMYGSIGEIRLKRDEAYQPRGAFAVQAARNGYVALAIEQRAMGERTSTAKMRKYPNQICFFTALRALGLGRTLIGERILDVMRAIDCLSEFPECDTDKILITGNSGGGTTSFYAGCIDERIKLVAPSCAFCGYATSIMDVVHCTCNYIPGAYGYFEMEDLACMIAPRKFLPIAGKEDPIFPIEGVKKSFETVKEIYKRVGAEENCRLVQTPKGHWWCEDIVWSEIGKELS
ncbi:MAG: acetylxylan esterase [Clostridia bacterium]|nr:acetylxylan esterase [Clostridia bacterium]